MKTLLPFKKFVNSQNNLTFNPINKMLTFLYKHYIIISVCLFGTGLFLTLYFNDAEAEKVTKIVYDGIQQKEIRYEAYEFKRKYELLNVVANTLYGLSLSILILIAIDKKFDEKQNEQTQQLKEQKEQEYQDKLNELQSKINQNVFDGVLKKFVPEELFLQVQTDIFNKNVIRQNALWQYEISHNEYNSFTLSQIITYDITNTKDEKHQEPINISLNTSSDLVDSKITYFKVENEKGEIVKEFKNDFTSPYTLDLKPKETKKVYLHIAQIYKTSSVMDAHNSNFSIIGLTIDVNRPDDIEFDMIPSFTTKTKFHDLGKVRKYDRIPCILIGQGINYTIRKRV